MSLVPNVNRSGKLHHPPSGGLILKLSSVPNVNRSGKLHHPITNPAPNPTSSSRTSTARASSITCRGSRSARAHGSVPNVNRSGKLHHAQAPEEARGLGLVPNVNRSGKLHHASSWSRRAGRSIRPERQPLGQAPSHRAGSVDAFPPHVPNVNRSGKLHHPPR